MNYKHLSQIDRYQIHSLMKSQHNITQIAQPLGRNNSTVSRGLRRNAGCRGCRAKQACELASKRSESSRNASTLAHWLKEQASELLRLQWSPEQIADKLPVSQGAWGHAVEEPVLSKEKVKALRQRLGSPRTNPQPQTADRR